MIDFEKLLNMPRLEFLLRCKKCGSEEWYTVNLTEHGFTHYRFSKPCGGPLLLVETRERKP